MKRSLITMALVVILITAGAIYEIDFVQRQFRELGEITAVLYDKVAEESASEDDVLAVQKSWLEKKKYLHAFIPHNEIKEIDLWLSEAVSLVKNKEWHDAISKLQVLKDLAEEIPKTFVISIENIL